MSEVHCSHGGLLRNQILPRSYSPRLVPTRINEVSIHKPPFTLGVVGHFGLAVRDPKKSAKWFSRVLGLRKEFEFAGGVAVGNRNITIALFKGRPSPGTIEHMSFHLPNMTTLRKALVHLKKEKVKIEDLGNEIGPEAPGSKHMGIWFHDPDGYRWELSVQGGR